MVGEARGALKSTLHPLPTVMYHDPGLLCCLPTLWTHFQSLFCPLLCLQLRLTTPPPHSQTLGARALDNILQTLGNWGKGWGWGLRFCLPQGSDQHCQRPSKALGLQCCLHGWLHIHVLIQAASASCPVGPQGVVPSQHRLLVKHSCA